MSSGGLVNHAKGTNDDMYSEADHADSQAERVYSRS